MSETTFDPLEASTRLGSPSAVPTSSVPAAEGFDPLAASTRLGSANPLTTSYEKVPTSTSRGIALGTRDMINVATGLPAAVADVATFLPRMGIRAAGGTATAPSDMWQAALDRILPRPETEGEKLRSAINEAAGATIGPMALGTAAPRLAAAIPAGPRALIATDAPVASLPLAASQVAAGGAGGAAGEVLANDERVPEWLKPSARLAGNMIGTGGVSALTGAAGTISNAIQGVRTPIAEALERLGIVPRTVGAVTDRPGLQKTEAVFSGTPVASGQLQPVQRRMVDDFGNAVHGTAQMLDPTIQNPITSAERAGNVVQSELLNWKNNTFPAEQAAVWDPLSQHIAGAAVSPSGYRTALQNAARDPALNSLPETQQVFIQRRLQTWLDALDADVPRGGNLSWEQAMALKRRIGDEMGRPDLVGDVGTTALKNVYGGLAGDMRTTAVAHGQEALFDAANQVTTEGHQFLNGTAAKAVRANNPTQETIRPDAAARSLLEDNTGMQQLRDRVPVAADALAAWKLRDMMTPVASSQGDVATGSFLTNLRKQARSDPEGQAALFTDPAVAQNVRDLETVANQFRSVEKNANASKTGLTNYVLGAAGGIGGALGSGDLAAALSVLGGSVGVPYVAGKMLTSPTAIALASARAGPRPPINSRVAGLLGYLANQ